MKRLRYCGAADVLYAYGGVSLSAVRIMLKRALSEAEDIHRGVTVDIVTEDLAPHGADTAAFRLGASGSSNHCENFLRALPEFIERHTMTPVASRTSLVNGAVYVDAGREVFYAEDD